MRRCMTSLACWMPMLVAGVSFAQDKDTPLQAPAVRSWDDKLFRKYTGVYRWEPNAFVYLQLWNEFSGFAKPSQLVAFDESGEIRTLYPTDPDKFFAGPGAAVSAAVESRIEFQRNRVREVLRTV
jgi:hypothetical protein